MAPSHRDDNTMPEMTISANLYDLLADGSKFRIDSKTETADGWLLAGEWIQIDLPGELAGLKPGKTTLFIRKPMTPDTPEAIA